MKRVIFYAMFFIFITSLINAQWVSKKNYQLPDESASNAIDAVNYNTVIISLRSGAKDHKLFLTENCGQNWTSISVPSTVGNSVSDVAIKQNFTIWLAVDNGSIISTTDRGITWVEQFYDTTKTDCLNYIEMFDENNGIAMGDAKEDSKTPIFLRTYDGGSNWISINNSATGGYSLDVWRRLDFINTMFGYFFDSGGNPDKLYKTTDGGNYWNETNFTGEAWLVKFYNEDLGLIFTIDYDLSTSPPTIEKYFKRTTDGGNTWEKFQVNMSHLGSDIEFLPGKPSNVWYTDKDGLYFSNDTGRTWQEYDLNVEGDLWGRDLVFTDENHGWLLCDNGKIYYTENNGGITVGVNEENLSDDIPTEFILYQNYPNPFNPTTEIKYTLKSREHVLLKLYNISGEEIVTLINGDNDAGSYSVIFDGKDLPSGVYIYKLTVENYTQSKKMVLLK